MRFKTVIVCGLAAASLAVGGAAFAWSDQGSGNIRCGDGSDAKVAQQNDQSWTSVQAGKNGKVGGKFAIEGQAALYACGE